MISLMVRLFLCFRSFCFILFQDNMCKRGIYNDITDCNSCLFSVSVCVVLFWSCVCKVVSVRLCVYMITL